MNRFEHVSDTHAMNVGPWERVGSVAAGAALLTYGLRSQSNARNSLAIAALPLLQRGLTGRCPVYARLGVDHAAGARATDRATDTRVALAGSRGAHLRESVVIARSPSDVYGFWRKLENLPSFMSNLERVTEASADRSHWVARGPAGTRVEWDAEIINDIPNRLIAWRSLPDADVVTAGSVRFEPEGRGTLVTVRMQYSPAGGRLGAGVSSLLGQNPDQMVRDDLYRLKRHLEGVASPAL